MPDVARNAHGHFLGTVPFDAVPALQQRLVYETAGRRDALATLLFCEHPPLVTIGRQGSRLALRLDDDQLARAGLEVRWVNRGGGAIVHAPGQLAAYAIVPLARFGFTVGAFLERWQQALEAMAGDVGFTRVANPRRYGLWSRRGQAAFVGVAVKNDVAYFGSYVNVAPPERLIHAACDEPLDGANYAVLAEPTTLAASERRPVRMPTVRQSLLDRLSTALGCERYHVFTGHPLLPRTMVRPQNTA
jgi:lipoyl(octanoyl) transferase